MPEPEVEVSFPDGSTKSVPASQFLDRARAFEKAHGVRPQLTDEGRGVLRRIGAEKAEQRFDATNAPTDVADARTFDERAAQDEGNFLTNGWREAKAVGQGAARLADPNDNEKRNAVNDTTKGAGRLIQGMGRAALSTVLDPMGQDSSGEDIAREAGALGQGIVNQTADTALHPYDSFQRAPLTTLATLAPIVGPAVKLGANGLRAAATGARNMEMLSALAKSDVAADALMAKRAGPPPKPVAPVDPAKPSMLARLGPLMDHPVVDVAELIPGVSAVTKPLKWLGRAANKASKVAPAAPAAAVVEPAIPPLEGLQSAAHEGLDDAAAAAKAPRGRSPLPEFVDDLDDATPPPEETTHVAAKPMTHAEQMEALAAIEAAAPPGSTLPAELLEAPGAAPTDMPMPGLQSAAHESLDDAAAAQAAPKKRARAKRAPKKEELAALDAVEENPTAAPVAEVTPVPTKGPAWLQPLAPDDGGLVLPRPPPSAGEHPADVVWRLREAGLLNREKLRQGAGLRSVREVDGFLNGKRMDMNNRTTVTPSAGEAARAAAPTPPPTPPMTAIPLPPTAAPGASPRIPQTARVGLQYPEVMTRALGPQRVQALEQQGLAALIEQAMGGPVLKPTYKPWMAAEEAPYVANPATGEDAIVYHGSSNGGPQIKSFRPGEGGLSYFSFDPEVSSVNYGSGTAWPHRVRAGNLLDLGDDAFDVSRLVKALRKAGHSELAEDIRLRHAPSSEHPTPPAFEALRDRRITDALTDAGYDGFLFQDSVGEFQHKTLAVRPGRTNIENTVDNIVRDPKGKLEYDDQGNPRRR